MGVRGRTSSASLSASLSVAATNIPGQRPEPPKKLSERQKEEWRAVVGRMPANWFTRENEALLVEYCRWVERSDELEGEVQAAFASDRTKDVLYLLTIAKAASNMLAVLATKMRLSQKSRFEDQKSSTALRHETNGTRPWQRTG